MVNEDVISRMLRTTEDHWQVNKATAGKKKRYRISRRSFALQPAYESVFAQPLRIIQEVPYREIRMF